MSLRKANLSHHRKLRLETLEDRRLMAADLTLTASLRAAGGGQELFVDGSDNRDVVTVLAYDATTGRQSIQLKLEQYSGSTLLSSRTSRYYPTGGNFASAYQVNVEGRGGNDTIINITSASMKANGGNDNDFLAGGHSLDSLNGGNGLNTMYGGGGYDSLVGGDQKDIIYGGGDTDVIYGGGGNDELHGDDGGYSAAALGVGKDYIYGGSGNDTIFGEVGDDEIYGEAGNDTIRGGSGNDWMWGGNDNDWIYGEDGSDRLVGNDGVDHLYGGAHDDFLDGGYWSSQTSNEADRLWGGTGADTFVRHISTFSFNDVDLYGDFNTLEKDKWQNIRHW